LLFVGLILLGQVVNAVAYREWVLKPRLQKGAEAIVRDLQALEEGLRALPTEQRQAFLDRFNRRAEQDEPAGRSTELSRMERYFVTRVAAERAAHGEPAEWALGPQRTVQMQIAVEGARYAVALPGLRNGRELPGTWLAASAATALLAILGAWAIQRRINRPLGALVQSAALLGRGERPPPLAEDGPTEIATVARGFNEMAASLVRNEQERTLMLAGLSHDLRTPLAKMRLATEMLREHAEPELLGTLERNIEAMDRLLGQFLDFTRAGQEAAEPTVDADLAAIVREALALCPPDGVEATLGTVTRRPMRMQAVARMVLNLVVNAQAHGRPPIEVACGESAEGPWLEVRDRGPGIDPAQAEALKAPFARGDAARSGPSGAGLGLAIVERIARAEGARFELLPREGGGLVARVQWAHPSS
jgi:two-component system osmolarity sensor histidine kinase EnvZ